MKKIFLLIGLAGVFLVTDCVAFGQASQRSGRFNRQPAGGSAGLKISPGGGSRSLSSYGSGKKWTRTSTRQPKQTQVNTMPKVTPPHAAAAPVRDFEQERLHQESSASSLMPSKISGDVTARPSAKKAAPEKEAGKPAAGASAAQKEDAPVSKTEIAAAQQDQAASIKQAQEMARQMGIDLPPEMQQMMANGGAGAAGAAGMPAMPAMPAGMPNLPAGAMPEGMPDLSQLMDGGAK